MNWEETLSMYASSYNVHNKYMNKLSLGTLASYSSGPWKHSTRSPETQDNN